MPVPFSPPSAAPSPSPSRPSRPMPPAPSSSARSGTTPRIGHLDEHQRQRRVRHPQERGTTARSLNGWTVRDAANHVYTFGTFSLGAGKSVVLRTGKGTNTSTTRYWGLGWHVWNNTGDTAYLRNAAGTAMDTAAGPRPGPATRTADALDRATTELRS